MKIITIHQPEHMPWLGLINKISKAEVFVILDSVQFEKQYFQNRNKILTYNGPQWITIPVQMKGYTGKRIIDMKISNDASNKKWRERYLGRIEANYRRHPYFKRVFSFISNAINMETDFLCDINVKILLDLIDILSINVDVIRSSELNIHGMKSDINLSICQEVGATTYISGPSGRDYLNVKSFTDNDISVVYNDYQHPVYKQLGITGFVSHLSCIDLFMNYGFEDGYRIIMDKNMGVSEC